ncbi:MAG: BatD family protein [Bacteroidaceae bacterium]
MQRWLCVGCACLLALAGRAQSVTIDASIDSVQILIGEQAHVRLEVSLDADRRAQFPLLTDTLTKGVEVVEVARPDTQYLNNGKRMLITHGYTVTSFDPALYRLPPFEVKVDGQAYQSSPLALQVYTVPVDTLHTDQFFGPKEVMKVPFSWTEWAWALAGLLVFVVLCGLCFYQVKLYKVNGPIIRRVKTVPPRPAHELALEELERIRTARMGEKGQPKVFYTELTETLRRYLQARFGFNAMEMTSDEILSQMAVQAEVEDANELRSLFVTADLVKFAKHAPFADENERYLTRAVRFVERTQAVPQEAPKPEVETTVEETRSKAVKVALIVGSGLTGVGALCVLIWLIDYVQGLFM